MVGLTECGKQKIVDVGLTDVVDARESKGLWMMHVCIFPNLDNNGPIYGFDVIAGKNKMTGVS